MKASPLRNLVSQRLCTCRTNHAIARPLTRSFVSTAVKSGNAPSPLTQVFGSTEELKRRYRPTQEDIDLDKIELARLKKRNKYATAGIILTAIATFGTVYFWPSTTKLIKHDAPPSIPGVAFGSSEPPVVETVDTGTSSVPTFPKSLVLSELDGGNETSIGSGDQEYQLVGLGIRTVSFLSIQVYVVGLYVAVSDIAKLQERLVRTQDPVATTLVAGEKGKLRNALMDAEQSEDIWNDLLKTGGIRSVFRIVPTRNTDFSHLKDGFLRQLTGKTQHFASNRNDQSFSDEAFGQSVNEFKTLFSAAPRKNLPKGEVLLLTRDAKGVMSAWYEDPKGIRTRFGQIKDERIGRLVWLQYLSGAKPSSEGARQNIVEGIMEYVERPVGTVATQVV